MVSKKKMKEIARERIQVLFEEAKKMFNIDSRYSDRYIEIARDIGMKHNVSLPAEFRRRICKECGSFLVPGENCRVRLNSKHSRKIITCDNCGNVKRFPY